MTWLAGLRNALRALRVNKMRSLLTMLGIIIGVAALITISAIGAGAQAEVEEHIQSLGANLIMVLPGSMTQSGVRTGAGARSTLTEDDAYALQNEIPDIEAAAPSMRGSGQVVTGNNNWATTFHGVTPEFFEARGWTVVQGREFDAADLRGSAKVVLLGETVASHLFDEADPIGQMVRVRNVPMEVIGVLGRKGQTMTGQDQDDVIFMPLSTARNRVLGRHLANQRSVPLITVKVREGADMAMVDNEMRSLLRQRHKLQAGQENDFTLRNLAEVWDARAESARVMTWMLAAIASVSLVVGGIGIMNIMLVSVTERTREIGLRMAVGARAGDILSQFLIEAMTLAVLGGLFGIALGAAAAHVTAHITEWRIAVTVDAMATAVAFAAVVGVFFGFYPARKASRLAPVEALRYE
jgi:putative ABC transport system permease protein